MEITRRTIVLTAILLAALAGWWTIRSAGHEIAVLRTFDARGFDFYTPLWIVDDDPFVWVRANRPSRRWLSQLEQVPGVELRRGGSTQKYDARIFDAPEARAYAEALFHAKYRLADRLRAVTQGRDTVPVRLVAR